ncbi:oligosaccharide flippase family protein [Microvirga sp. BT688]|uniref:oligosaccharide flippase family protein n=1 Tax=Microvirga sp. TaxID=1873136 RepID=UPI0016885F82|nr:oligosaccharide flippase family protein [Microvirga sp.]MBD2750170.1 oligosaccharide flippase family protein [Microvirga sp.]
MSVTAGRAQLIANVRQRLFSSSGIVFMTTVVTLLIRLVGSMILTRLLSPDVYGTATIIISLMMIMAMLTDLGFHAFLLRHPAGDDPHFLDIIWTIHALRGLALTIVAVSAAPTLAHLLQKPEIAMPLAVASVSFLLNGLVSLGPIVILRSGGVAKLCFIDIALLLFQTIVGVLAALIFRSAWAVIGGYLAQAALNLLLSYILFPFARHRLAFSKSVTEEFWRFSKIIMVSSILSLVIGQADKVILARVLTLEEFGLYAIALNLASVMSNFASIYVTRVLYPMYAKLWQQGEEVLAHNYYIVKRQVSMAFAFLAGAVVTSAAIPIYILYDNRYVGAAFYLSILAFGSILALNTKSAAEYMTASGRITGTMNSNIARIVWLCFSLPVFYHLLGPTGVVVAFSLIEIPALIYFLRKLGQFGVLDLREEGWQGLAAFAGLAAGHFAKVPALAVFNWYHGI